LRAVLGHRLPSCAIRSRRSLREPATALVAFVEPPKQPQLKSGQGEHRHENERDRQQH
jgi:hypothetical protein